MKKFIRPLLIAAALLIVPAVASQFVEGWNWSPFDYVFAGIAFLGLAGLAEVGLNINPNFTYRAAFSLALISGFLMFWGNAAVGFIGSEETPINLLYPAALAIAFLSAITVRFQARNMARVMFGLAIGVALIPVIALLANSVFQELPETAGALQVIALNAGFVVLFVGSGLLFRQAGEKNITT